jgi:hypothetical protein
MLRDMSRPAIILVNLDLPDALISEIRRAAPSARLITRAEAKQQPELWRTLEVMAYRPDKRGRGVMAPCGEASLATVEVTTPAMRRQARQWAV